jgi:LuxR family transcriptional regulator, maltose regulon positive regulatory protein
MHYNQVMPDSLLVTKLYTPQPPAQGVERSRLIERLNAGLHRKMTLISAAAGFGKTTLLSEWAARCERPVAWLSLDPGDSDPSRFLGHMVASIQTVSPSTGAGVLSTLHSPQPPPAESILTVLINEIAELPAPFVLMLDDYHAVDSRAVDEALTFLLENLPRQLHLVIGTREDPHLPLAKLRARGQLTEIRAEHLRFNSAETYRFLNEMMGLDLSEDDATALEARTEGWIAGLQLAAISLQGHEDSTSFIKSFTGSHRFVLDYLVEEVLQRQPEHVQKFLLSTSILDRMCGPLCEAVLGDPCIDGQEMLRYLEQVNLFTIPLDSERRWFRYHHLFAELLRQRAMEEQPERLLRSHRRASKWHELNELPSEAIRHALMAEDFENAARLVELVAHEMLLTRREETFLSWLAEIPYGLVRKRPVLSTYYALALVSFDLEAAEVPLRDAERFLEVSTNAGERAQPHSEEFVIVDEDSRQALPGLTCIIRAYQSGAHGDVSGIVEYAQRALEHLPEDEYVWRGAVASLLGLAQWTNGDLEAAYQSFVDGIALLRMSGDVIQSFSGAFIVAHIRAAQGRLRDAESTYERAMRLIPEPGEPLSPPAVDLYVGMSELYREYNDLEAAIQYLLKTKKLTERGGISEYRHRWYIAMALIKDAQGDPDQSLDLLGEAERLFVPSPDPVIRPISALKTRVWIRQERLSEAWNWAREHELSITDELSYLREFEHITLARLLLAQFRSTGSESAKQDAMALLERLREASDEGGRNSSLIEILILQALTHEARGDIFAALIPLERALSLAEPEGYVRIFLDEGAPMAKLLAEANAHEVMPDCTSRLLAAFEPEGLRHKEKPALIPARREQPLVEPLSQRELEVLRLVALGLSNREISDRLFLALNTVKGHNRVIFSKLQVHRRTEAIARARELGLL